MFTGRSYLRNRAWKFAHIVSGLCDWVEVCLVFGTWYLNEAALQLPLAPYQINTIIEPSHEILALFVVHKLILQTYMRCHPVRLDVLFLVEPFVYFHTSCVGTAKALVRLHRSIGSPEPSLVTYVISTIISWAGSIIMIRFWLKHGRKWGKTNQSIRPTHRPIHHHYIHAQFRYY